MNHFARGRHKRIAGMNKLEAAYAQQLELRKAAGEVLWWAYEPMSLRLAPATHYRPDFAVMLSDCTLEIHETKGNNMEDDSWCKLKIAAALFPFQFILVRHSVKLGWTTEVVG